MRTVQQGLVELRHMTKWRGAYEGNVVRGAVGHL